MAHNNEKSLNSIQEYLSFIANTLILFIHMLFYNPKMAIKKPEHLFALGHVILLIGLLIPSRSY
jgi:hypothetical protein